MLDDSQQETIQIKRRRFGNAGRMTEPFYRYNRPGRRPILSAGRQAA
jgi:hypothetical protein